MTTAHDRTGMTTSAPAGPDLAELSDDELAEERDFLLRSLRDLEAEREAGDVDDDDYDVLKDGYTGRAAAVLRALESRAAGGQTEEVAPAGAPWWRRRRTLAVVALVAVFAVGAGVLVAHSAGQRLPGDTVSGSTPNSKVQQLVAQAEADVQKTDYKGALKAFHDALQIDPQNVQALAEQGWFVAILGNSANDRSLMDQGLASIRQAEQIDPSYAGAHFYAGSVLLRERDPKDAVTEFQAFLDDDPSSPQAPLVRQDLQTAQALAAGRLPPGASLVPSTTAPAAP
jgi:cytochrome c-type biogenesis protein CcmH/NrfG